MKLRFERSETAHKAVTANEAETGVDASRANQRRTRISLRVWALSMLLILSMLCAALPVFATTISVTHLAQSSQVCLEDSSTTAGNVFDTVMIRAYDDYVNVVESITFTFTIGSTTNDVVVRVEGSPDNVKWVNIRTDGDRTVTADGTYATVWTRAPVYKYYRFTYVSCSGSTPQVHLIITAG